ncbi:MAG: response regulator [Desulfovibrio sp.]|nr:response regulator [Desulfovibrio sp.]
MSIRLKMFLMMFFIVAAIVVTTMGASLFFIRSSLDKAILSTLNLVCEIADNLVSTEINRLKALAETTAHRLMDAKREDWAHILKEQVDNVPIALGLAVFNRNGFVQSYGKVPMPASLADSPYMVRSLAGESIISTTRRDPSGELVVYVGVPMRDYVLTMTIPGMHFRDVLAPYKLWNSGAIYILDEDGTVIAHERAYMVNNRYNAMQEEQKNPAAHSWANFVRKAIKGGKGDGYYCSPSGIDHLAVYTKLSGSKSGWVMGVSATLSESPVVPVARYLLLTALILLGMGLAAAFFTSRGIVETFQLVEKQNEHLAELNELAHSASEAKSRFLANMSHEMRTPLNAIIGFSELMLSAPAKWEECRDSLEKIYSAGMILLGTVNDVLDISKIESGKFELVPVEYNLASLINDTVTMNILRIGEKPIQFGINIDENLPGRMVGDELRIRQICNNLLSNAFKYTLEGNVDMHVSGEVDGDSVWLTFRVRDTGIGIAAKDMDKLFLDYTQLDSTSNRKIEGTGLGLSIARRVAEMMDGRITVESEYGKGSTFTARVRQRLVTDAPIGASMLNDLKSLHFLSHQTTRSSKRVVYHLPDAKVLIVDDVLTNLEVALGMLKPYGMQVDFATSGQQAIDLVREEKVRYNAIFMDHMMPGMDGIEAVRRIREEIGTEYAKTVPIIALTANAIVGNEQIFLERGFQAFLDKPIDIPRLDMVMKQWVRDKVRNEEEEETASASPAAAEEEEARAQIAEQWRVEGFDALKCLERFGGDREACLSSLRTYSVSTPALLDQLREPAEKDISDYTIVVHGIKSSSYGICAMQVGKAAEELEHAAHSGDFAFIKAHNEDFLKAAEKLIAGLSAMLRDSDDAEERKPKKYEPDAETLDRLREACELYDMDGVDSAMAELEKFTYEHQPELIPWIRERVDKMNFQEILAKLSEQQKPSHGA